MLQSEALSFVFGNSHIFLIPPQKYHLTKKNYPGRDPIVTNLPGEAKRQLVHKNRGDMSCKEYTPAIKVLNHNVPHKSLSPTMILWNKQRQLSRRIVTTPLHKQTTTSRPRVAVSRHAILFAHPFNEYAPGLRSRHVSELAQHVIGYAQGSGLVTLLSLRNTSHDSPTRHCPVVEPIACLSVIASPHLLSRIFYTESDTPGRTHPASTSSNADFTNVPPNRRNGST